MNISALLKDLAEDYEVHDIDWFQNYLRKVIRALREFRRKNRREEITFWEYWNVVCGVLDQYQLMEGGQHMLQSSRFSTWI